MHALWMGEGWWLTQKGTVNTVWRREGQIFTTSGQDEERLIGTGKNPALGSGKSGEYFAWNDGPALKLLKPGQKEPQLLAAEGSFASLCRLWPCVRGLGRKGRHRLRPYRIAASLQHMPEQQYDHTAIESKWAERWSADPSLYRPLADRDRPKFYVLEMLPYPSGTLHIGHVRNYAIGDALARYKWMRGFNVLHPMGWDAFGLPAENAAIKNNRHPREWTLSNIAAMKKQHQRLGFSYDWDREVSTCEPEYYRWNQWFFLRMLERGLAYRKQALVNWCSECGTVLANEQVVNGCCWRHETVPVQQRELDQWFFRITAYAEELLRDIDKLEGHWPDRVLAMQRNWIGRSEGAEVDFRVADADAKIRVFTTRIDTIYGATCVILAPGHPMVTSVIQPDLQPAVKAMIDAQALKDPGEIDKVGLFTGSYAINPFSGQRVPIWIGNFVLMGYGTGAIMAVPAHDQRDFEFCTKYSIPVVPVIREEGGELADASTMTLAFGGEGIVENSGEYSGLKSAEARSKMAARAEVEGLGNAAVTFRIKDWGVSRQRYWGTPIPVIYCPTCGAIPVPDEQLPVRLPEEIAITGKGRSPLENVPEFVNVPCPKCGSQGGGRRTRWTLSWILRGTSTVTAIRITALRLLILTRLPTGSRSINTLAV